MEKKRLTRATAPKDRAINDICKRACWKERDTFTLALLFLTLVNHHHLLKNVLIIIVVVDFFTATTRVHFQLPLPAMTRASPFANSYQPVPGAASSQAPAEGSRSL
jgi:hypothetical protein